MALLVLSTRAPVSVDATAAESAKGPNTPESEIIDIERLALEQSVGVVDVRAPDWRGDKKTPWKLDAPWDLVDALLSDTHATADLWTFRLTDELKLKMRQLKNLKHLKLRSDITADDLRWIGSIRSLQTLELFWCDLSDADLSHLRSLKSLEQLDLDRSNLTNADLRPLADLESLRELDLENCTISDDGFATLPRLQALEKLHLDGCANDVWAKHLAVLRMPNLRALRLGGSDVTDQGVDALSSAYDLNYLSLYAVDGITGNCVESIARMKSLKLLGVGLSGICPTVRRNQHIKRLEKLLPNCNVDYGD